MTLRRILEAPIADLTFEDVEAMIQEEAEEGPRLELKRDLPANDRQGDPWMTGARRFSNPARDGLAKEVVALANTYGGAVVVGVDETDDHPKRARGPDPVLIPRIAACAEQMQQARPHHHSPPRRPRLRLVHSRPDPRVIGAPPALCPAIAETAADIVRADLARRGTQITPQTALDAVVAYVVRVRGFTCPVAAEAITCTALEIIGQRELAAYATGLGPLPIRRRSVRSRRPLQLEFQFPDPSRAA